MLSWLVNPAVRDAASGIFRHLLTGAGAYLATKGWSVDQVNTVIGFAMGVLPIVWSMTDKVVKSSK